MNRHFRILTLGLLLLAAPALAQTTPPADPNTPPAAPTDTTTPAPPTTDQTTPAPPTPDQTTPTPAPTTPATSSQTTPDQTVTLPALSGVTPLRTVSTVLGQAAIYAGAPDDVLTQTLTALQAQGYTTSSGDTGSGSVTLSLNGRSYLLRSTPYLGLTVVSLSRVPMTSAAASAPGTAPATDTSAPATGTPAPATDTAAPATDTPAPADTTTPPPTDTTTPPAAPPTSP